MLRIFCKRVLVVILGRPIVCKWQNLGHDRSAGCAALAYPGDDIFGNRLLLLVFLILPWIESKGLASKILSRAVRQLPNDWLQRYDFRPVLMETFVEFERHRGTCYKAANWINVGRTTGRGKKSSSHKQIIPVKDIWLYPLRKDFATVLCQ